MSPPPRYDSRAKQVVEALDPDRDVDNFIERRRNPGHAPLYGVALSLLDWALVDHGRDSTAKSQTQEKQQQQHTKQQQDGVAAGSGETGEGGGVEAPGAVNVSLVVLYICVLVVLRCKGYTRHWE